MELLRSRNTPDGVLGSLLGLCTLEDDWKQNVPGESCIPAGDYELVRTIYHKHGYETFEVVGVPGRGRILIHPGNTEEDTKGCILLGLRFDKMPVKDEDAPRHTLVKKWAVYDSKTAFHRFMTLMTGIDRCPFQVRWAPGLP